MGGQSVSPAGTTPWAVVGDGPFISTPAVPNFPDHDTVTKQRATQALASFAEQLASWGQQAIELGQSPFRKVETNLPLLTGAGELQAPLVFWINRDSFMAGGLVLFPRQNPEELLEQGQQLADGLGLRHFVTWAPQDASIWELAPEGPRLQRRLPLAVAGQDQVEPFRQLLLNIMEQLKLLSVMAAPTAAELSPFYLANLCRETIGDSLEELTGQARIGQSQAPRSAPNLPAEIWAAGKAWLSLFRLLALLGFDLLPPNIQPEGLERALRFALPGLPEELNRPLRFPESDFELPASVAVRFHHLFRRLLQLDLPGLPARTAACCQTLLQTAGPELLSWVPDQTSADHSTIDLTLEMNLITTSTAPENLIEIAPQPLLAGKALLRSLQGQSAARQQADLWRLDPHQPIRRLVASLGAAARPNREQRLQMETSLRSSWPTRRFQCGAETPEWLFQCLHLLGLCRPDGELELTLPGSWLTADWGGALWELLCSDFSLLEVSFADSGRLRLQLRRSLEPIPARINGQVTSRLPRELWTSAPRQHLGIRLQLSEPWLELLDSGALIPPSDLPENLHRQALQLFFQSRPGQELAGLAGITNCRGTDAELSRLLALQVPVPNPDLLTRLEPLLPRQDQPLAPPDATELLDWLGAEFRDLPALQATGKPGLEASANGRQRNNRNLPQQLAEEVFVDGIPQFPEHYLYDHFRPELLDFHWQQPLQIDASFFGQIRLRDAAGETFEVAGEAFAHSLILIDRCGRHQVALPTEQQLTETILLRYLRDLQRLYERLHQLACRQELDARGVARLVRSVWGSQPLPPWEEIKAVAAFFSLPDHVE